MADAEVKVQVSRVEVLTEKVRAAESVLAGLKEELRTAIDDQRQQAKAEAAARAAALRSAKAALVKPRKARG